MVWLPPQRICSSSTIHGCPGADGSKLAWSVRAMNRRAIYPTIHLKGMLLKGTSSLPLLDCGCSEEEEAASTTEPLLLSWKAQLVIQSLGLSPKAKSSSDRRKRRLLQVPVSTLQSTADKATASFTKAAWLVLIACISDAFCHIITSSPFAACATNAKSWQVRAVLQCSQWSRRCLMPNRSMENFAVNVIACKKISQRLILTFCFLDKTHLFTKYHLK